MNDTACGVMAVILVFCSLFSCLGGHFNGKHTEREQAIKAGVAKWTVNEQTGETKFEYITGKHHE